MTPPRTGVRGLFVGGLQCATPEGVGDSPGAAADQDIVIDVEGEIGACAVGTLASTLTTSLRRLADGGAIVEFVAFTEGRDTAEAMDAGFLDATSVDDIDAWASESEALRVGLGATLAASPRVLR